ncbi:MAG: hypothetical protein WED12_05575 [Chloroflexota bacterium]
MSPNRFETEAVDRELVGPATGGGWCVLGQGFSVVQASAQPPLLAHCPTCPPLYASLVGIQAAMGGLRDPDSVVEDEIAARILDRLRT